MEDAHDPTWGDGYFRKPRTVTAIWFAFLAGPSAWCIGLMLDYALVRIACTEGLVLLLHGVTLVTLALALSGGLVAWREWGRAGREKPGEGGSVISRTRFMMSIGVLASAFFAVVILSQWAAKLFLHPCMGV